MRCSGPRPGRRRRVSIPTSRSSAGPRVLIDTSGKRRPLPAAGPSAAAKAAAFFATARSAAASKRLGLDLAAALIAASPPPLPPRSLRCPLEFGEGGGREYADWRGVGGSRSCLYRRRARTRGFAPRSAPPAVLGAFRATGERVPRECRGPLWCRQRCRALLRSVGSQPCGVFLCFPKAGSNNSDF